MPNVYDQFDATAANPYDQFDTAPKVPQIPRVRPTAGYFPPLLKPPAPAFTITGDVEKPPVGTDFGDTQSPYQQSRELDKQRAIKIWSTGAADTAGINPSNVQKLSDFVRSKTVLNPVQSAELTAATAGGKTVAGLLDWLTSPSGLTQTGLAAFPPSRVPMAVKFFNDMAKSGSQSASDAIDAWNKGDKQGVADNVMNTLASFGGAFGLGKGVAEPLAPKASESIPPVLERPTKPLQQPIPPVRTPETPVQEKPPISQRSSITEPSGSFPLDFQQQTSLEKAKPAPKEELVPVYRAEGGQFKFEDVFKPEALKKFQSDKQGEFWTTDPKYADYFKETYGKGAEVKKILVPASELEQFKTGEGEYKIPPDIRSKYEPKPATELPPIPQGQKLVTIQKPDGSTIPAVVNDPVKYWQHPTKGQVPAVGRLVNGKWSHGMLGDGEKIVEQEAPKEGQLVGMGAATPSEFENKPTTPTAIKNATVDEERAKRGLPPAMQPARRDFGTVWDTTMAKYDKDPIKAYSDENDLIKELSQKPRAITDSESAVLLHRQIELHNEYGKATRELNQAADDSKEFPNRLEDAEELKIQVSRLSDQLHELYDINKRVGTETARGLAIRRMMAYEDYSLAGLETRLRAEQRGKPLTPKQKVQVNRISENIENTKKAIEDYQKKVSADSTDPRLKGVKSRYAKRIDELKSQMESGNYAPKTKNPLVLDEEGQRLKAAYERAKLQFDRLAMQERLKNRTLLQKTQDTFVKWRRAFLLSSPVTLAKLTTAAIERMVITPLEEGAGAVISKLPIVSKVARMAPREGGASITAEARALTDGFMKGMSDAARTLKTGHSDLDNLYGKREVMPRELIDFIGAVHGALKAPVKRAEFARSFQKRIEFAIRHGQDVTDPMVQSRIAIEAYKDANRSIFMQDNKVTAAWNAGMKILKSPDKTTGKVPLGRRTLATAAQTVLPIVKVPTNIVAETFQYALGSVTGSVRLASALAKGIETLKPEEADLIMRELKKGSLGAALLLVGFFNPATIGGYYQANDKRMTGHPKFGTIKVGGVNFPSFVIHNPLLETLQIGATARHVADSRLRRRDQTNQGVTQGAIAGLLGMTEEVPFVNEPLEFARMFNPYERNQFADQFARDMLVPLGVSWVAQHFDKDVNGKYVIRKTDTLEDTIKSAIPGLRETLPVDYKKTLIQNQQ